MKKPLIFIMLLFLMPVHAAEVIPFAFPGPFPADFLEDGMKIAVYTFTNRALAGMIHDSVIIAEKSPAGGLQKDALCMLAENNDVYLYNGSARYMHAKYMINSVAVLVTTENMGSFDNRGFGAIVYDEPAREKFLEVFYKDLEQSIQFECDIDYQEEEGAVQSYHSMAYENQDVSAVFAPDAVDDILDLIDSAEDKIYIEQFYIYKKWGENDNPFLDLVVNKARQGLEVKILLDSTWYNVQSENDNDDVAAYVNEIASKENLNIEAKLYKNGKLHGKLVIIDDSVLVSSINWNENSPRNNREAGIVIHGNAADFYREAFLDDFHDIPVTGLASAENIPVVEMIIIALLVLYVIYRLINLRNKRRRIIKGSALF